MSLDLDLPEDPRVRAFVLLELAWQAFVFWSEETDRRFDALLEAHLLRERADAMVAGMALALVRNFTAARRGEEEAARQERLDEAAE